MRSTTFLLTALFTLLCTCASALKKGIKGKGSKGYTPSMPPLRLTAALPLLLFALAPLLGQVDLKYWDALAPRNIGPSGMSGRVTAIDVNPTDKEHIYVGTASGGVWMSRNGGISFEPLFDDQKYLSIGSLTVSDANPNIIWVGTGEGNPRNSANYGGGIYKSIDGGKSWRQMGLKKTRHIHRVIAHPTNPDVVYAGALGSMWGPNKQRGVYKTTDGGETWKKILYVDEGTGIADMVMDPSNPDKLMAATWTFDRDPDFFNSGGPGSGIWVTHNGGDGWERRTAKNGLPKGDLGRIGITISHNKPNIVYALVEAKKNGLYKSTDGGMNWRLVTDKGIGGRPFYYAEIYVDPQNENRLFDIATYISRSEDGGKTFKNIANYGNAVHPDHHAFWIDAENPQYIIDGNDGGLNISRDGGDTWRFAANLPLAQLYHINYDMSYPYLVGGGMQDNGSWVGPSQGLKSGGITESDWQEVYFGDGFDLIFKPGDANTVYAASQGGALGRVNRRTGKTKSLKPLHPDGTFLRFNWNAPIAQGPQSDCTIYMGSQFVHKSTDCGNHWEIISPDLTTNDTTKQRQMISGGLTIDATQAENHTTLLCIIPGSNGKDLWVSSDDGRLHLSKDDGKNWTDLSSRLPGMTAGSWIPYIEVSQHNAAEAWVVVNDFRRNDRRPIVYHTDNYGETFTRVVDEKKVSGHALAIVQDPVEPNLLFLGTDQGLWISFDKGAKWTHYNKTFPGVSTRDIKIHPREHDLILGTFGRAVWILDDIRPFREIATKGTKMLKDTFVVFPAPDAYQWSYRSYQGTRFYAQGQFQGKDRRRGAMLTYWVMPQKGKGSKGVKGEGKKGVEKEEGGADAGAKEGKKAMDEKASMLYYGKVNVAEKATDPNPKSKPKAKVKIQVVDVQSGDTIRTYTQKPNWGMNRTSWNMRRDGIRFPSRRTPKPDADTPSGPRVGPGVYELVMTYGDHVGKTMVTVHADPREDQAPNGLDAQEAMRVELDTTTAHLTAAWNDLQEAGKAVKRVQGLLKDAPKMVKDSLGKEAKAMLKSIAEVEEIFMEKANLKGIQRNPTNLRAKMYIAGRYIGQVEGRPTQMAEVALAQYQAGAKDFMEKIEEFLKGDFSDFRKEVEAEALTLFGKL